MGYAANAHKETEAKAVFKSFMEHTGLELEEITEMALDTLKQSHKTLETTPKTLLRLANILQVTINMMVGILLLATGFVGMGLTFMIATSVNATILKRHRSLETLVLTIQVLLLFSVVLMSFISIEQAL